VNVVKLYLKTAWVSINFPLIDVAKYGALPADQSIGSLGLFLFLVPRYLETYGTNRLFAHRIAWSAYQVKGFLPLGLRKLCEKHQNLHAVY